MAEREQGVGTRSPGLHYEFWLDGGAPADVPVRHRRDPGDRPAGGSGTRRQALLAGVVVVAVVAVAVPLAVVLAPTSSRPPGRHLADSPARRHVLAALGATVASGSFDITYAEQPATSSSSGSGCQPPSSASGVLPPSAPGLGGSSGSGAECSLQTPGEALSGQGTIDTDPLDMVATSQLPGLGTVTTYIDGYAVWEEGGGGYGLSPGSGASGPGSPIPGFAGLVEGTLGPRQGGLSMMDLASPTGYLELDQAAITAASETGTGTVGGTPVTDYLVDISPAAQADPPGATSPETEAIQSALGELAVQGYTGTKVTIAIDASGYIRQTVSVAQFSDGATQTTRVDFSNFGCAGHVLMPGQTGSTTPPAGCVSPDRSS